jgi:hypothetical protein
MKDFLKASRRYLIAVAIILVVWLCYQIITVIGGWHFLVAIGAVVAGWNSLGYWLTDEYGHWEPSQLKGWGKPLCPIIFAICAGYLLSLVGGLIMDQGRDYRNAIQDMGCGFGVKRAIVLELDSAHIVVKPVMWHFNSEDIKRHSLDSWSNSPTNRWKFVLHEIDQDDYEQLSSFAQPATVVLLTSIKCKDWDRVKKNSVFNIQPLPQELLGVSDTG